jgi:hypothetical protein
MGTKLIEHAKIDRRKARWFFVTSMMATVDDLKTLGRASSLPLFDFIEALCKVAECVKTKGAQEGLSVHFEALMAYLQKKLSDIWGGTDEESVAQNMQRVGGGLNKQVKKKKSGNKADGTMQVSSIKSDD